MRLAAAANALCLAYLLAMALASPARKLASTYTADDAFFYLVIARNFASGKFSSFDGTNLTNGYHPLWALAAAPLAWLPLSPAGLLRAGLALHLGLHAASAALLWKTLAPVAGRAWAATSLCLFPLLVASSGWYITEAPLAVAAFALFVYLLVAGERRAPGLPPGAAPPNEHAWAMLAGAATVLARLDSVFLVVPPLAWLTWRAFRARAEGPGRLTLVAYAAALFAAPVALYVASNLALYGHPVPISGSIKSSFPRPSLINIPPTALSRWGRLLPVVFIPALYLALRGGRRGGGETNRPAGAGGEAGGASGAASGRHGASGAAAGGRGEATMMTAIAGGAAAFAAYELFFQRDAQWGLYSWHFAVSTLACLVLLPLAASRLRPRLPFAAAAVAAACLLAGLGATARKFYYRAPGDATLAMCHETAEWVRDNLPPGSKLAATDPGIIAFFSGLPTVNLDGLINNFDFQDVLRRRELEAYLERNGVTHVLVLNRGVRPGLQGEIDVEMPARLYPGTGDRLALRTSDLVYLSSTGRYGVFRRGAAQPRAERPAAGDR